jgi:hypothetical protein
MGTAFLVLFPAGVVAMRSGSAKAFRYHWVLQLAASILIGLGVIAGLLLNNSISTLHQGIGIAIGISTGIQAVLGWRHHVLFLRIRRRTRVSRLHVGLGRLIMAAGWSNIVTGMLLRGYPVVCLVVVAILAGVEMWGLTFWVWWTYRKRPVQKDSRNSCKTGSTWGKEEGEYFALADDDEDEDDDSDPNGVKNEAKKRITGADDGN